MKISITIILFLTCFTLTSKERGTMPFLTDSVLNLTDVEFKELEKKLESEDPTFRFQFFSENDVSLFLAAQKKRPQSFIWIDLINMSFAGERYNARQLENKNERKILFENALQYLTESLQTLENVILTNCNDSTEKVYNFYLGILKEDIAFAALGSGDLDRAKQMARELLKNNVDTLLFNFGNTIHNANTILGQVALRENDLQQAKEYLIKSVEGPTSPQLSSFGPSYILAKELLEIGEKHIVLEYLDLVANVWANPENINPSDTRRMDANQRKLDMLKRWKEEIKSGKIPNDPPW